MPVRELELVVAAPAGAVRIDDERTQDDRLPVAAVGACVHPHAPARRAGDGTGELESAEAGCAGTVKADGVGRSASGEKHRLLHLRDRELAFETDDERVHSYVGCKQVGAEPDRAHVEPAPGGPVQCLLELCQRAGSSERGGRPADPDGRHPRERDALLDPHVAPPDGSGSGRLWERPTSPSHGASLTLENARVGDRSAQDV